LDQAEQRGIADEYTHSIRATALAADGDPAAASQLRQERINAGSRNPAFYHDEAKSLLEAGQAHAALAMLDQAEQRGIANEYTQSLRQSVLRNIQTGASPSPVTAPRVSPELAAAKQRIASLIDRGKVDAAKSAYEQASARGLVDHELAKSIARLIAARKPR
jgi:hypothetical protein